MRTQKIEQSPAHEQTPALSPPRLAHSRNRGVPRRPAQPVSAARPPLETSEERPEASRPDARLCGGYMMGSGMGGGFMLGSGN
jgi:hypothetical protein